MTLNEAIAAIQTDPATELSAEARNALHGCTDGHPWCEGKDFETRKLEARFALAGRRVDANHKHAIERATS